MLHVYGHSNHINSHSHPIPILSTCDNVRQHELRLSTNKSLSLYLVNGTGFVIKANRKFCAFYQMITLLVAYPQGDRGNVSPTFQAGWAVMQKSPTF